MYELTWWGMHKYIVWSHEDSEIGCYRAEVQSGRLWASLFSNYLGSAHQFKNRLEQSTQKGEMGGLFEPICMQSSTEGVSPPEKTNWMHADLQIEVEKRLLIDDWKTPIWHAQGSIFQVKQNNCFASHEWSPINSPILMRFQPQFVNPHASKSSFREEMLLLCWITCKSTQTNHQFPPFGCFFRANFWMDGRCPSHQ